MKKLFLLILSALLLCILTGCGASGQASETEETQAEPRSFGGYLLYHPQNTDEPIRINAVRIARLYPFGHGRGVRREVRDAQGQHRLMAMGGK